MCGRDNATAFEMLSQSNSLCNKSYSHHNASNRIAVLDLCRNWPEAAVQVGPWNVKDRHLDLQIQTDD
jgi:hypothetical protein